MGVFEQPWRTCTNRNSVPVGGERESEREREQRERGRKEGEGEDVNHGKWEGGQVAFAR